MAVKKELYNVAIAGQGYILAGTPDNPARRLEQAPVYGNRFASGDRDYTDFSLWWYWAQTDWSGGIKQESSWEDDAKYHYSYNIDAWSEYGAIKLASGLTLENSFAENICCGYYGKLGTSYYLFVGTMAGSPRKVYRKSGGTWSDITGSNIDANVTYVSQIFSHKQDIWILCRSDSTTTTAVLSTSDASSYTNHTSAINTALGWTSMHAATCCDDEGETLYVAVQDTSSSPWNIAVVSTNDSGGSWSSVFTETGYFNIVDLKVIGGNIYYLLQEGPQYTLKVYDISASVATVIWTFHGTDSPSEYAGGTFLTPLNSKLIIQIPRKELWAYNISDGTLTRIYKRDETLNSLLGGYFVDLRFPGGLYYDNKVWYPNLMYDGVVLFNTIKNADNSSYVPSPMMADTTSGIIYYRDPTTKGALYKEDGYKTSGELVFNRIDIISTIDKLWHSLTFVFDKLSTDEKITFYYSVDEMATWTEIGGVDYAIDGGSVTSKTIFFPENTVAKKIWLKVKLSGGGSSTPVLRDVSIQYLPLPDYKQRWTLQVYCYDDIMLLDGKTREPKRGEELRNILKTAWWSKEVVDFHDIDYAETTLDGDLDATSTTINVDSTAGFPEQGRIRIDDEEILYTGKTATAFTGCTRGARGTEKSSHSDGSTVSNGYKVLITDYVEKAPIGANAKIDEYIVALELREV